MKNSKVKDLKVRFVVTQKEELGWRKYFTSDGDEDNQISLFNFPPFRELEGSKVSVITSKVPRVVPRSCLIVAREVLQIPRDLHVRPYFDEPIPGVPCFLASLEASRLNEGDSFSIHIPQKSRITSHEKLRAFLLSKYYMITESAFSKPHKKFMERMKKMRKEKLTDKDVFSYFDFPEILSYLW